MKCPKCGSKRVAPIMYGYPAYDEEMERKLKEEKLYLGGCCITDMDPSYHCFECGKDIASPPILISKRGAEDYRNIVTSIHFMDGGFFGGRQEVLIKKKGNHILLNVQSINSKQPKFLQREMTDVEWKKLLNRLYNRLYLHEWKKRFDDYDILDGEQWSLELKLTNDRVRKYSGSNAFPPYWAEPKTTFRPFFKEAGIKF